MAETGQPVPENDVMPRLLLVEDNPLHVRLVRSMLDEIWPGFQNLAHVSRLDKAIEFLARLSPDCILLDLILPDAEGLAAVHALLRVAPDIPIVVLSAHDDEAAAMEAVREGAQDYLVKGTVGAEGLAKAIRFAIERHRPVVAGRSQDSPTTPPEADSAEGPLGDGGGVAILDNTGAVRFADKLVAEMLGKDLTEFVGVRSEDVIHPGALDAWREALEQAALMIGSPFRTTTRIGHPSGADIRLDVELTALYAADGAPGAFIARYEARIPEGTASSGGTYAVMTGWAEG